MANKEPPRFLLLLPPTPSTITSAALQDVYGDTISQVLKEVATHSGDSPKAAVLEIAVACPHLIGKRKAPRSSLYNETQTIVAGLYKLICAVATREAINIEDVDGVDARVLIVTWSPEPGISEPSELDTLPYNPVVSLETLAKSGRNWQYAFGLETEIGGAMVKAFVNAKGNGEDVTTLKDGSDGNASNSTSNDHKRSENVESTPDRKFSGQRHTSIAIGGTFDHIHIGHKLLLTMTVFAVDEDESKGDLERSVTIGITGDQLLKNKKHREVLESWEDRYKSVMTFVNAIVDFSPPGSPGQRHVSIRDDKELNGKSMDIHYPSGLVIKCTEIQDPFGPTITDEHISAMIVSAESRAGGKAVNDKREEKGWKPLELFEVDVLDAEEDGETDKVQEGFDSKLSSTAIREKLAKKRQSSL